MDQLDIAIVFTTNMIIIVMDAKGCVKGIDRSGRKVASTPLAASPAWPSVQAIITEGQAPSKPRANLADRGANPSNQIADDISCLGCILNEASDRCQMGKVVEEVGCFPQ